jgi:hypothetical protein
MFPIKLYCNMNNQKIDNVNVQYGFTFLIHLQLRKTTTVTVLIVHLTMFSPLNINSHMGFLGF